MAGAGARPALCLGLLVALASVRGSAPEGHAVAVVGAAGSVGELLSLLLRRSRLVHDVRLFDLSPVAGLAADLQHIDVPGNVTAFADLADCLHRADAVVVAAGVARTADMSDDECVRVNGAIVRKVAETCAQVCPEAVLLLLTEPIEAMVPLAAQVLRRCGVRQAEQRVLGATGVDAMRANRFLAERAGCDCDPAQLRVPVIGGHGGWALPLFSRAEAAAQLSDSDLSALLRRVRTGAAEVASAREGTGPAVHAVAEAAARLVDQVLASGDGVDQPVAYAFTRSPHTKAPFLAGPVIVCRRGVARHLPLGTLSATEQRALEGLIPALINAARQGRAMGALHRRTTGVVIPHEADEPRVQTEYG